MIRVRDFDLKLCFESGQPLTFYGDYSRKDNVETLGYVTQQGAISITCAKGKNGISSISYDYTGNYTDKEAEQEIVCRLGLDHRMESIYASINTDMHMGKAIKSLRGMRITGNEPWEATLCFVTSQFNNIKRIRGIVKSMISKNDYGVETEEGEASIFPSPEAVSRMSISELARSGAGFRAKYLKSVAEECAYSFDLSRLRNKKYGEAKEQLLQLDGVGDKVADCILLYGYGKFEAFPIDTWIKRTMEQLYFNGKRTSIRHIHEMAEENWGPYAGYAQQYLFHAARLKMIGAEKPVVR